MSVTKKREEKCETCRKPPQDGCSRVVCPNRKQWKAEPIEWDHDGHRFHTIKEQYE